MAELTVSQRGLVALMAESAQNAAQGFSVLAGYERPEDFFDELEQAGLFAPEKNPAPRPSDESVGGMYLPYWPALGYLINVAKVANARQDVPLGHRLMGVIRAIATYAGSDGLQIDNYYTNSSSAEIAGLVPPECVRIEDIELVAMWLDGGWNSDGIVHELEDGMFASHLRVPTAESIEKLARLLEITTRLRHAKGCASAGAMDAEVNEGGCNEDGLEQRPEPVADAYWLDHLLKRHAVELGRLVGEPAVSCLIRRAGEAFGSGAQADLSWLSRAAVEEHEQNHDWDYLRGSLVRAAREALEAWLIAQPQPAAVFVGQMLRSPLQIVRRIGIHACRMNWLLLEDVFFDEFNQDTLRFGHLHELYLLLSEKFVGMSRERKDLILDSISLISSGQEGEELDRARYRQWNWLHAIHGKGESRADAAYETMSAGLGSMRDHPDLLSYHQMSWGAGPSPYDASELVGAASSGRLVQLVDEFAAQGHPLRSPRKALLEAVSEAVVQSPRDFLAYLSWTQPISRRLQYALLSGFGKAIRQAYEDKRKDDAESLVGPLLRAQHALITDSSFWEEAVEESVDFEATRNWIPPVAVEFVGWLCNEDDLRIDIERKAMCLSIVQWTIKHSEGLADADDALTAAINNSRGKAFDTYLALLLRSCRDADKSVGGHANEWAELRPIIDSELDRTDVGGYEIYALIGSHIQQLIYVDVEWVAANISRIFPSDETKFRAAVIGLGYSRASERLYSMIAEVGIPARVLFASRIEGAAREGMVERVALSYIWGQESLDGEVIGRLFADEQFEDIRELAQTVGRWSDEELTLDQKMRALALGARCAEFALQAVVQRKALLAVVAEFVAFQVPPDPRDLEWLEAAAPYVTEYHGLHGFMESVVKVAEASPEAALRLMRALVRGRSPHYDYEGRIERTVRLIAAAGFRVDAIRLIDAMSSNGVLPSLMPVYEELLAGAPQA